MRLKFIFFKVLHTVIGETLGTIFSSTIFSAKSRMVHRSRPSEGNQGTPYLFLYILTVYIKGIGFLEGICGRFLICDYRKTINHWSKFDTVSHRTFIARLHVEVKDKALYPIAVATLRANLKVSPTHHIAHIIKDLTWHSFLPVLSFFSWSERIYYIKYWK